MRSFRSKTILIFGRIILALFIFAAILTGMRQSGIFKENILKNTENITIKNDAGKISPARDPQNGELAKVIRVIDGDTIEIEGGERVRYIGMDTPETVDPRKSVQCFGVEASNKNKELVEGKTVLLKKDISERDRYGRLLRYVFINNNLINLELVEQGFAYSDTVPPDVEYQDLFLKAQSEARAAGIGLWGACPLR